MSFQNFVIPLVDEMWEWNFMIIIIDPTAWLLSLTLANWRVMAMIRSAWPVMDSTNKVVLQIIFCYVEATHMKLNSRFDTSSVLFPVTEYNAQDGGAGSNGSDFLC